MLTKIIIALVLFVVVLGQDYNWDDKNEAKPDSGYYDHTSRPRWEDYVMSSSSATVTSSVQACMVLMPAVIAWMWSK